jgi:hypothetical protein
MLGMIFDWLTTRRRRRLLATPFPPAWDAILTRLGHFRLLSEPQQAKLRAAVRILLSEKTMEGCRGLVLTDEIRVTIAAQAALLLLGWDHYYFDNVSTILVYPSAFVAGGTDRLSGDAEIQGNVAELGEAHPDGVVVLSWKTIKKRRNRVGNQQNLVIHEFTHALDMTNREYDGTPALPDDAMRQRWADVMWREYQKLQAADDVDADTLLDPYGAESPAEFFAVAVETFFEAPGTMEAELPELYALLCDYFQQDPARRLQD